MDEPLVVLIYSHPADYQPLLEWQLRRAGLEQHHVVVHDFSWRRRQLVTRDVAREFAERLLIFPDAWDTVLLGDKAEIMALDLGGYVTLAAARNCWPDPRRADYDRKQRAVYKDVMVYLPEHSPWRYVNSNPLAGFGRDIARAIAWGWERFPLKGDSSDVRTPDGEVCERFWTSLYLDGPPELRIRLDTMCRLNQVFLGANPGDLVYSGGRVINTVTGTKPVFLHLNGKHLLPEELIAL